MIKSKKSASSVVRKRDSAMSHYYLVKEVQYKIVKAESEEKAMEDYRCPLHSQYSNGSAMVVAGPVEANNLWEAQEKLRLG